MAVPYVVELSWPLAFRKVGSVEDESKHIGSARRENRPFDKIVSLGVDAEAKPLLPAKCSILPAPC